jgi:hypothetical protein
MKKFIALAAGAALIAAASFSAAPPASAAMPMMMSPHPHFDHNKEMAEVMNWCHDNPRDSSCHDWDHSHHHWSDDQYHSWYLSHYHMHGFDPGAALAFGFAAGIGSAIAHAAH